MTDDKKKLAVGYVRMSKEELESEPDLHPEAQERVLKAFCEERGMQLVEVAADVGVRTSQPLEGRKAGRRLLTLVKDRAVDAVVALSLDRLFHNATEALRFANAWKAQGVDLFIHHMGGEPADTASDSGATLFATLDGASEMEHHLLRENQLASAIQATLVPDQALVQLPGIDLAGTVRPATYCWGDWWNYYRLKDDKSLIVIGDVTGHGVASAIVASAAQSAVALLMDERDADFDLPTLFRAMNVTIHRAARGRLFMTCFACIFDPRSRVVTFANAGHNFSFLFDVEKKKLSTLVVRGQRLGDSAGEEYVVKDQELTPDTTIVWYSDGIVECENFENEEYGARRFRRVITKTAHLPADQVRDQILNDVVQFAGEVPPRDDVTLVVGRVH